MLLRPWRRITRVASFGLLIGLAGLAALAGTNISRSPDTESWGPRVTTDSLGTIHAVWLEQYSLTTGDIYYSQAPKGGSWTTPINISQSRLAASTINQSYRIADLGVDSSDNLYCVWIERTAVKFRVRDKSGWGSTTTLSSGTGVDSPRMSVTSTGNIYVAWMQSYKIWSKARINGNWESARQISGSKAAKNPGIDAGPNGVYCVFNEKQPNDYRIAWTRRDLTFNATWASTALIYNGPIPQTMPVIKVDSSNVAHCVYLDEAAEGVRTARYSYRSGSSWTSPATLSATSGLHYPAMSIRSSNLYPMWQQGGWGNGTAIRYNLKLSGSWTGERAVPDSQGCTYGDIEADENGQVHFVWDSGGEIYYYQMGGSEPPPPPPPPPPPVNKPPTAKFTFSPSSGWAPQEVEFDGGSSYDPDGAISSWSWQFGDGGQGSGSHLFHAYLAQGTYTIRLTVTDNSGASASTTKSITIRGLYPPKDVQWTYNVDQSLFSERWVAKVTWSVDTQNEANGYVIDHYDVYRQEVGGENDAWKIIKSVAANGALEYLDTDVQSQNQFNYGVKAVDTSGHISAMATWGSSESTPTTLPSGTVRVNIKPPIKR